MNGSDDAEASPVEVRPEEGSGPLDAPLTEVATADPAVGAPDAGDDDVDSSLGVSALSVESLLDMVETLTHERDGYLDAMRRNQAEFENARKRMIKQQLDQSQQAASHLVEDLLPVLDACDGAVQHGADEVTPIFAALLGTLEKSGLERLDPVGEPFDPTLHEAVMHETATDGDEGTLVVDVMRRGYVWKGRVIRPAMVKVRG
ncbi:MAG: nucleotide exchange factor GrpE [Acidimicrobiales bacterium]